jgi:bifunctional DNA-binding transcriptional regulator/antitoxin component of YhaV-PrlF toxin-antitoxin module
MRLHRITKGGQISLPASVRHRWGTKAVSVEDLGDHLVVRPIPDDPIAAARGVLEGRIGSVDELRARAREDELIAEDRGY